MGMIAALSAVRPDPTREAFEQRLRRSTVEPFPSVPVEFSINLDGSWRTLMAAFSEGDFRPSEGQYDRREPGGVGIWAVRGRHRILPERLEGYYEETFYYNDLDDVRQIAAWLGQGPSKSFMEHFRAEHERYVDEWVAKGASEAEIVDYAGGTRDAAPYVWVWVRMVQFYQRAAEQRLWVMSYIR